MSNTGRLVCYLAAFIAFVIAAILSRTPRSDLAITFIAAGLALFALVPLWDAVKAS